MGDYKDAISDYTKSIEFGIHKDKYEVYYARGLCNLMLTRYRLASEDFDSSLILNGIYYLNYTYKGACYYYTKKYKEALSLLDKSIELESNYEPTHYYRCMVKYYLKDYYGSIADCNLALSKNKHYNCYYWRGLNYIELKRYEKSIADFDTVLACSPKDAKAYYYRGIAYCGLGDYHKSIEDITNSIQLDPSFPNAYYSRALSKFQLKQYTEAEKDFNAAYTLGLNDENLYCWRGANYYELQNYSTAIENLNKAILQNPNNEISFYYRGLSNFESGNYNEYVEDYNAALALKYYARAEIKFNMKDYKGALKDLNESLRLNPTYELAVIERGVTYYMLKKDNLAINDLTKAIMVDSTSAKAYYYRYLVKKNKNDVTGSNTDLMTAQSIDDNYVKEELSKKSY